MTNNPDQVSYQESEVPTGFPTKVSLVGVYEAIRSWLLCAAWIEAWLESWRWRREGNDQLARKWQDEADAANQRCAAFNDELNKTYSLYQRAEFCWFIHQTKSFHLAWENLESAANSCYYAICDPKPVEEIHAQMETHPAEIHLDEVRDPFPTLYEH
jgi:hypothetical protein